MLHNIPFELQRLDQWVVATGALLPNGKRDKVPLNPRTGRKADVCDPTTWGSFAEAQQCGYPLVGFVLSKDDPYCIIDLDDPRVDSDGNEEAAEVILKRAERHAKILEAFGSYSELSQSGNGIHIICRGAIPHGVRRDKVELYSAERYMICTGTIYKALPIADCQELVLGIYHQMNTDQPTTHLMQVAGHLTDDEIYHMGSTAANADKFNQLWRGEWRGVMEWPSQSEADFALLSMLCFYTKDNEQVRRIFRWSALGARDKARRNDGYLNIALSKIRAKELPAIDFAALLGRVEQPDLPGLSSPSINHDDRGKNPVGEAALDAPVTKNEPLEPMENQTPDGDSKRLAFPPGFIGELADYFYASAIRPVPEIALVAAIALTAGVAARTFNISGSGLNQYLILLARTGSGKEGAATGIDAMVSAVRSQCPMVDEFIGPGAFASGQALIRVLDKQDCFVSVLGEFGLTLQSLCDPNASAAHLMLKKVLLDVYAKSGFTKVLRPNVYSETEKNTRLVQAPNITILGEATPESFYDGLDASAIAQGLVPRFSIFEYDGPRPPKNPSAFAPPPKPLVDKFAVLLTTALAAKQNRANCPVQVAEPAQIAFDEFDARCDHEINAAQHDVILQLWNRAHLKALKLAALVAVGINPHQPIITQASADWAMQITERDIRKLLKHFSAGDIGQGDTRMEADLRRAVDDLFRMGVTMKREYAVPEKIMDAPIIPLGYLRRRLRSLASFRNHRLGASAGLASTIKNMCESGELQQIPSLQAAQMFSINSPLYVKGAHY